MSIGRVTSSAEDQPATSSRTGRRTAKGERRAQRILEVAAALFRRYGYAQTTMEDIARQVGLLNKGGVYYYVESKEQLLYLIVSEVNEDARRLLDEARSRTDLSLGQRILLLVDSQLRYTVTHFTQAVVYNHEWHRLGSARYQKIRARRKEYELALADLLEAAAADGEVTLHGDVHAVTMSLLSVLAWPYTWYRPNQMSIDTLAYTCVEFARGALRIR